MRKFSTRLKFMILLVFGIIGLAVLFSGCGRKGEKKPAPKEEPPVKIGIAMATMEGDGYAALKKAMEKLKKEEKADLVWMDAKNDPATQAKQIDELVKKKVKVIILHMVDPKEGRKLVGKLQEQKIRVIAVERLPENVGLDGYVTPDYLRAGELQGKFIAKAVTKGTVLLVRSSSETQSDKLLRTGFLQGLGTMPNLVLKEVLVKESTKPKAIEAEVLKALKENPAVEAIVTQTGFQTLGLGKYLQSKEQQKRVKLITTVGLGADKSAALALAEGNHDAEVDTRPDLIAYYALKGAKLLAKDQHLDYDQRIKNDESDVPTKVIPVRLVKEDNLYLLTERWGDLKKEAQKAKKEAEKKQKEAEKKAKEQNSGAKVKITDEGKGDSGQKKSSGEKESSGQQGDQASKDQPKKTKLMIKTKEGKTIEIEVDGEIKEITTQAGTGGSSSPEGKQGEGGSSNGAQ